MRGIRQIRIRIAEGSTSVPGAGHTVNDNEVRAQLGQIAGAAPA